MNNDESKPFLQEVVDVLNSIKEQVLKCKYRKAYFLATAPSKDLVLARLILTDNSGVTVSIDITYETSTPEQIYKSTRSILIDIDKRFSSITKCQKRVNDE
jgi:hypothetical protein